MRILTVLGTRPELVKLAPVLPLLDAVPGVSQRLLHTGQHYSIEMDAVFFSDLQLRKPDVALQVGSGPHGAQTAAILQGVEKAILDWQAEAGPVSALLTLGDTNSTLGSALAACKLGVPVVHIEAGCRSFLRSQPEEINRILVDHCADQLLAPDETARENLRREGLPNERIAVVGSTSIDAALLFVDKAKDRPITGEVRRRLAIPAEEPLHKRLLVLTLHRAENTVDAVLAKIMDSLANVARDYPIAFAVHPRTKGVLERLGYGDKKVQGLLLLPPLSYLDMLALVGQARALLTDSGGLQEEAAAVGTPALILRNETEWTYLVDAGRNALVGNGTRFAEPLEHRIRSLLTDERNSAMRDAPCSLGTAVDPRTGVRMGSAARRIVGEIVTRITRGG